MKCIHANSYYTVEGEVGRLLAVRRARVNFCYAAGQTTQFEWTGVVGCVRDTVIGILGDNYTTWYAVDLLGPSLYGRYWIVGGVKGYVADFPYPPLPGIKEDGTLSWSRLVASIGVFEEGEYAKHEILLPDLAIAPMPRKPDGSSAKREISDLESPIFSLDLYRAMAISMIVSRAKNPIDAYRAVLGAGRKMVGEEFRVVEKDADYLRLRGRGGDEYLAWDFVLGKYSRHYAPGPVWVLIGVDGLYEAEYKDGVVVVSSPFWGSILDVRGPPYAPLYPVVPVRWVRNALEKIKEKYGVEPYIFTPPAAPGEPYVGLQPVEPEVLLKWPLRDVEWNFKIEPELIPPNGGSAHIHNCEEWLREWTCREVPIMCSDKLEVQIRGVDYQEKYYYTHIVSL